MPAHELESAGIMFEVKRRASELMQTPLVLETDSEASAQMLSTTPPRRNICFEKSVSEKVEFF